MSPSYEHARRYNRPEGWREVAVLLGNEHCPRGVVLHICEGGLHEVTEIFVHLMHFTLCCCLQKVRMVGTTLQQNRAGNACNISIQGFYAFHLH